MFTVLDVILSEDAQIRRTYLRYHQLMMSHHLHKAAILYLIEKISDGNRNVTDTVSTVLDCSLRTFQIRTLTVVVHGTSLHI